MQVRWRDPVLLALAGAGLIGLGWLLPLMVDQFTLFGDREQLERAERSMVLMFPASALLIVAAAGFWARVGPWHAILIALPVGVSVVLAWTASASLYQLLSFALTGPLALGAILSALIPPPSGVPRPAQLVAGGALVILAVVATPLIALMGVVAGAAWWFVPVRH